MPSVVTSTPPASSEQILERYAPRLAFETDCADVHTALAQGDPDFVVLDVRSARHYAQGHVPGAINLLRGKMTARRMAGWTPGTLFVVYCAGPHCNGADRAAVQLASLRVPVKIMIGGATGWADEGYGFATLPSAEDPQPALSDGAEGHATATLSASSAA